jgi:hypothetical protein
MIKIISPTARITIGINSGEVVSIDWHELLDQLGSAESVKEEVVKYIDKAKEFLINQAGKTKSESGLYDYEY